MQRAFVGIVCLLLFGCQSGETPVEGTWRFAPVSVAKGEGVAYATLTLRSGKATFGIDGDESGRSGTYRMVGKTIIVMVAGRVMRFEPTTEFDGYIDREMGAALYDHEPR